MLFAIFMAFWGPIFHAGSNILDAHVCGHIFKKTSSFIFYLGLTNILVIPFLFFFGVPHWSWPMAPYIIFISFIEVFYLLPYFLSLKRMDTSIVAAMFSLGKVFLPVLSFFILSEELNNIQYVGFFIVIFSSIILNLKKSVKLKLDLSFWMMMFVSIILVIFQILSKKVLEHMDWVSFSFYSIILSDFFVLTMLLFPKIRQDIGADFKSFAKNIKLLLFMEVLDRVAGLANIFALSLLPVVIKSAISATQPIFVLLYGVLLFYFFGDKFKEDLSKKEVVKKIICFLLIIAGVVLTING